MQAQDRVEKLLALLLIQQLKAAPQRDKALHLSMAGFTNTEIADLLQTTTGVVAQSLYEARRKPKSKAKRLRAGSA
jgi:DNA-directed RNA polymerase specialized sigma24 family protein